MTRIDRLFGKSNSVSYDTGSHWLTDISFPVRLGRRLSQLREKRGLSQTQLADLAQIGRAHLSQIENGAVAARIDTLQAVAVAFEMTLSELLEGL